MINKKQFDSRKIWNKSTNKSTTKRNKSISPKVVNLENKTKIFAPKLNIPNSLNAISSLKFEIQSLWQKLYPKNWFQNTNLVIQNIFDTIKSVNFVGFLSLSLLVMFFFYLAFFDQYFSIQGYTIRLAKNSYINKQQAEDFVEKLKTQRLMTIIPLDQYWFVNSLGLTTIAQQDNSNIKSIDVKNRTWPNQIELEITTKPNLLTLSVKENGELKYWRVGNDFVVNSLDVSGFWQDLVTVEKPYSLINENFGQEKPTLQNYNFATDSIQSKRFELTKKIWELLNKNDVQIISTTFPSLDDSDILFQTKTGTVLYFDSQSANPDVQLNKIKQFFVHFQDGKNMRQIEKTGNFKYLDFRVGGKVFICQKDQKCNTNQ